MHNNNTNTVMKFSLLKILILTPQFQSSITETVDAQDEFINMLQTNQYTPHELIELIHLAQDKQVKSILITHLLSMEEYLNNLSGHSILNRLDSNKPHVPSRLNKLVHQIDVNTLSLEQIKRLQPEAAISILCSVPHFHLLNQDQINELIGCYQNPAVIHYWMNHYALFPNAHFTLAHLARLFDSHVIDACNMMSKEKKSAVINTILEHLELFNPRFKVLHDESHESHLKKTIHQYLNGSHHTHYVTYIRLLTKKLLSEQVALSLNTIQLLISLNQNIEFGDITHKTSHLISHYLRVKAQSGDISLFYNHNKVNIDVMTQWLHLTPPAAKIKEEKRRLIDWIKPAKIQPNSSAEEQQAIPEHSLIQFYSQKKQLVNTFNYFLLHFKGNTDYLSKAIRDYLGFYLQAGCTESRRKTLYHTAVLINRPEARNSVREAIYTSFLEYPELYDEQICCWMLRYDAQRTLQHFGLKGGVKNYILVMTLCRDALKKLNPMRDKLPIQAAKQAYDEAKLELSFSKEKGIFAQLIQRIKRCWINGWTGFFSPNLPVYVAPAYQTCKEANEQRKILEFEKKNSVQSLHNMLPKLLTQIEKECSIQKLNELVAIMRTLSLKMAPEEELHLRTGINFLYHELLSDSKTNKGIDSWLAQNHALFNANRFRLLELLLKTSTPREIELFIKQFNEDSIYVQHNPISHHLNALINELAIPLPELKTPIKEPQRTMGHSTPVPIPLEIVVPEFVSSAWSWAKESMGGFFTGLSTAPLQKDDIPTEPITPNPAL
ncbi:hypothetical protein [Legionella worsleiensis]|uniref:Dot/Icm T4SS effector n=1 Tax=Legionella worsleiensis TaxID=45076 RepID=A0A0W1AJS3_9GAMM|nr:hypothetical protein [Legionella worsleiensis]KTD81615.1 Dot/Icm T4SS effector [Legionella worsleiensis]STY31976.1 Dot/Icm secretion system substrate [Legionella worsleiensis]